MTLEKELGGGTSLEQARGYRNVINSMVICENARLVSPTTRHREQELIVPQFSKSRQRPTKNERSKENNV